MCQVCLFSFFRFISNFFGIPKITSGHHVDGFQTNCTVSCSRLALLQSLERCLRLAKAVSWTTNFGYEMMRSSISLVETSIPP